LHLVGILFPHINDDARLESEALQSIKVISYFSSWERTLYSGHPIHTFVVDISQSDYQSTSKQVNVLMLIATLYKFSTM